MFTFPFRTHHRSLIAVFLRPEENEYLADVLHRFRSERTADFGQHAIASGPICGKCAHLYQFVGSQTAVDFSEHCARRARFANGDERPQGVGAGAQRTARRWR